MQEADSLSGEAGDDAFAPAPEPEASGAKSGNAILHLSGAEEGLAPPNPAASGRADGAVRDAAGALAAGAPALSTPASPPAPPTAALPAPPGPPAPVHQLATALGAATTDRTEIRLDPAELGRLRFEITQRGEVPLVVLAAERPETADLLRRHLPELQAEFREMGFAAAEFSFAGWDGGRDGQDTPGADGSDETPTARTIPDAPAEPAPQRAAPPAGGLDLRL